MTLRVSPEDLVTSGLVVTGHGEDVATKHAAADGRIEAAQAGWRGLSAAAMSVRAQTWLGTTTALLTRMSDHAQALHASAQGFAQMDAENSRELESLPDLRSRGLQHHH